LDNPVFIIVPCYNEAAIIRQTIKGLLDLHYTVVVVDDASTDNVQQELGGLRVFYLRHAINLGQGAALQTGIDFAVKRGAAYMVTFDADGQHDAKDIEGMIDILAAKRVDIILGSRFLRGGSTDSSGFRKGMQHAARYINYIFTGILLSDAHNGLRAMNCKAASSIRLRENRMAHASEFLMEVKRNRLRFEEYPVHIRYTAYSKKKGQSPVSGIRILVDLVLNKIFE
jgi:polyprenyl-phospho-N-acetylgalactosaminyl synthase